MLRRNKEQDELIQFGKELDNIFEEFFEFQLKDKTEAVIHHSKDRLLAELDIDIDKLLSLPKDEMKTYLQERKLRSRHFEKLGDYLTKVGELQLESDKTKAKQDFEKVIEINELADEISKTFSFDRMNKNIRVKNQLEKV
ncbi:MAG: hypothetical protein V7767_01060 [Leeuwenhoekiella sp.]